jgi:hypothetical protein
MLVEELRAVAAEDAQLLAEGKPLPHGLAGSEASVRLPVTAS